MSHFAVAVISDGTKTIDELLLPYMENCCSEPPKEYMEFYENEECDIDPDTGKRGYWQNPNAKWDWYVIGGRWYGALQATQGTIGKPSWFNAGQAPAGRFDSAKIKHIDFSDEQEWWRAVVTPDGEWHEVGEMGWWGISSETSDEEIDWALHFKERFIDPCDPEWTMTIVDCHI